MAKNRKQGKQRRDPLWSRPRPETEPVSEEFDLPPVEEDDELAPDNFDDLSSHSSDQPEEAPADPDGSDDSADDSAESAEDQPAAEPPAPFPIKPDYSVYVVTGSGGKSASAKVASGKAKQAQPSSGSIQDIPTFVRNAEQFISENQLEGSGLDYLRGALKSGVVELALKYVGPDGRPLTDLKPSDEFNKVACADVMRQLNEGEPVVASKAINTLIMRAGTEGFQQACEQMSDEERRSYAAGMEEIIRAGRQQPSSQPDSDTPPAQP